MKKLFSFLLVLVLSFSVLFAFGCEKPNKGPKAPGHKVICLSVTVWVKIILQTPNFIMI
ncbi:MAG: hypothetical protein IKJ19_04960 [Clostridia bacterium]|nr:hypothetical protein [Clostridia bacterium]